ncbi:MAG: hypothetical protein ACFFAN_05355 [Promethearchaeota archaeon]
MLSQHPFNLLIDKKFRVRGYEKENIEIVDSNESSLEESKRIVKE